MYAVSYSRPATLFYMETVEDLSPSEKLARLREGKGLSLREVAKRSEGAVSHSYISDLEKGLSPWNSASLTTVKGLARAYDLSVVGLLDYVNGNPDLFSDTEIVRSNRTVSTYRLTASGERWEMMKTSERTFIDEDLVEGDYVAFVIDEGERYRTTLVVKRQEFAEAQDDIVCRLEDVGVVVAEVIAHKDGTYYLAHGGVPVVPEQLEILGVVVSTRRDRIKD